MLEKILLEKLQELVKVYCRQYVPDLHWHHYNLGYQFWCTAIIDQNYLLNTLHGLGFCSSYDEIQMFGNCALVNVAAYLLGYLSGGHVMIVVDNVDRNTRTLDGKNTFHGMGMIAAIHTKVLIDSFQGN